MSRTVMILQQIRFLRAQKCSPTRFDLLSVSCSIRKHAFENVEEAKL